MKDLVRRVDSFQQRIWWAVFGFAVVQKFSEDQAGNLAALIAYYAFFSIFPVLVALVTILGSVLARSPGLQQTVLTSTLGQLPIIGTQGPTPADGDPGRTGDRVGAAI